MSQRSFASAEHAMKKEQTRREKFLGEMERIVPWARLMAVVEPLYPTSGRVGRQPTGLAKMLRMYCLQQWYGLADEALEDALYDSQALRDFVGIDLSRESVPDATTLLKFRWLLNDNNLTKALFDEINAHLGEKGLLMRAGTIVDATIIAAPSSTKNEDKARDADKHQTKKGNQRHFGMKAHIGVDADSGLVHSMVGTAANVNDVTQAGALLHGQEVDAFGDAGYRGVHKRARGQGAALARGDAAGQAPQTGSHARVGAHAQRSRTDQGERAGEGRASVPRDQEPVPHKEVRYKGLAKNEAQLFSPFGLANIVLVKRRLLDLDARGAS